MSTGSGKTHMAELVIEKVLKSGYKAIYLTPLRALANQQCSRWSEKYTNYKVGVFTGETAQKSHSRNAYASSQLLVMTIERFDACLRNWKTHWSWIPDVSLVVIDEVHLLGRGQRGSRLEGAITRMIRLNPFVRFIGLSATIPNVDEVSSWLKGKSFHSSWRQTPIEKKIDRFSSAKDKPQIVLERVKDCISHNGQSIVFCNSRSRVQQLAEFLIAHGIPAVSHHAGLIQEERTNNEQTFCSGKCKVMVATSTVEMGLNFPARQVIIYDSYSYTEKGFINLPVWSYIQRMGRAGRPGLDTFGECCLLLPKWSGNADIYLYEKCEPVDSQLTDQQSMVEQILIDICAGYSRTRNELTCGFLPLTFYKQQHKDASIDGILNKLILNDLLIEKADEDNDTNDARLKVGLLGRMAVKLMLSPETVTLIKNIKQNFDKLYIYDLLLIACMCNDCSPLLRTNYEEMDVLCTLVQPLPSTLLDLTAEKLRKKVPEVPDTLRILSAIKMAAICYSITNGDTLSEIAENFDVYESDIRMLQESVVRILMGISAISTALDKSTLEESELNKRKKDIYSMSNISNMVSNMVRYNIDSQLVSLTCLKGVGGKIAKKLSEHGYSTTNELRKASIGDLEIIDGIGEKLAKSIIDQVTNLKKELPVYSEGPEIEYDSIQEINTFIDPYRLRRSLELSVKGKDGGRFCITGGREDHIVVIRKGHMQCDCLDYQKNQWDCKHILCAKRAIGDPSITKMVKRIRENKNHSIREALPSLWYSMNPIERK